MNPTKSAAAVVAPLSRSLTAQDSNSGFQRSVFSPARRFPVVGDFELGTLAAVGACSVHLRQLGTPSVRPGCGGTHAQTQDLSNLDVLEHLLAVAASPGLCTTPSPPPQSRSPFAELPATDAILFPKNQVAPFLGPRVKEARLLEGCQERRCAALPARTAKDVGKLGVKVI